MIFKENQNSHERDLLQCYFNHDESDMNYLELECRLLSKEPWLSMTKICLCHKCSSISWGKLHSIGKAQIINFVHVQWHHFFVQVIPFHPAPCPNSLFFTYESVVFADGASLQQAADLFKIPKTVLWRRVQKEIGSYAVSFRARMKQSYGSDKKQAAVKALERGENLTKVSHQFQVIKHSLL